MRRGMKSAEQTCPAPKAALKDRPLITPDQAAGLTGLFKILAGDTRLLILHALVRASELCVNDLAKAAGMKPQAISNQLQRLSDLGILESKRKGTNIFYRIVDPCVAELLDTGLCLLEDTRVRKSYGAVQAKATGRLLRG